jgi:hypothetical protein
LKLKSRVNFRLKFPYCLVSLHQTLVKLLDTICLISYSFIQRILLIDYPFHFPRELLHSLVVDPKLVFKLLFGSQLLIKRHLFLRCKRFCELFPLCLKRFYQNPFLINTRFLLIPHIFEQTLNSFIQFLSLLIRCNFCLPLGVEMSLPLEIKVFSKHRIFIL